METATAKAEQLRRQIRETEQTLEDLRQQLHNLETSKDTPLDTYTNSNTARDNHETPLSTSHPLSSHNNTPPQPSAEWPYPLSSEEYTRYARQLILPSISVTGQLNLKTSSILIIGAGGLGCPAAAYLSGAGIGHLGIVDGDIVEASNLHRQIAHSTSRVGQHKVHSLVTYCRDLNPLVRYTAYAEHLTPQNAPDIVAGYDVILDCTDHPTSRYLISDVCVLLGKTLISASALRTDGQLIVLNSPPTRQVDAVGQRGPCYRCVFPKPPPADSVVSCGEGGILGPVVGVMGVLQALEAIKIVAAGIAKTTDHAVSTRSTQTATATQDDGNKNIPGHPPSSSPPPPSLLLFSAGNPTTTSSFRTIRMRGRRADCFACSASSTLTLDTLRSGSLDYVAFCGVAAPVKILSDEERISAKDYYNKIQQQQQQRMGTDSRHDSTLDGLVPKRQHMLIDVREKEHFDIASLPGAINVPFSKFQAEMRRRTRSSTSASTGTSPASTNTHEAEHSILPECLLPPRPPMDNGSSSEREESHRQAGQPDIYVICRLGNDSQVVARELQGLLLQDRDSSGLSRPDEKSRVRFIGDIQGGMAAWKRDVDRQIPFT